MSIQSEINARTVRLREILAGANQSITAKSGRASADLSGLPAAIDGIPAGNAVLQVKGVVPNGKTMTVVPDSGYDGLSAVNVAGDVCLVSENIAEGVTIYGVTGTYEGGEALEWEDITVTPTGEEITLTAAEGKGFRSVTVEGDENLIRENILVSTTIYGVAGKAMSGLQAPEECISRLWDAIYALYADYTDYINEAIKPGGPNFFVSESEDHATVGIVCPQGMTVTEYDSETTEFFSYGWISYSLNKSTGEHEVYNYWTSRSPGGNFAKNIKYSTQYIEYGGVTLFPVGQSNETGGSDDARRYAAANLFPYLSFEESKYRGIAFDAVAGSAYIAGGVGVPANENIRPHTGECLAAVQVDSPVSGGNYIGIGYFDVCRAIFGHRYYCQGWCSQPVMAAENPGFMEIGYGDGRATSNVIARDKRAKLTTEGEWELLSGLVYVDPVEIRNAGAIDEIWLRVGIGVGLESTESMTLADDVLVVDLTETFGVGNEPTEEECRAMFENYDGISKFACPVDRPQYYLSSATEIRSNIVLSAQVACQPGDLVVAAIATRDALVVSSDWTLLSTSNTNSNDVTSHQRLSWAYKIAENAVETITVTQASSNRIYINMVAISNATGVTDNGYFYQNELGTSITVNKPAGLILWAVTCPTYPGATPYPVWQSSYDMPLIQLGESSQSRLAIGLDQSSETSVTFEVPNPAGDLATTLIAGALTVHGIDRFY